MSFILMMLVFLLLTAVIFGACFLVFKLVWMLLKKKGNKWPLFLSGGVVLALALIMLVITYLGYTTFVRPLNGLMATAKARTTISTSSNTYKDPRFGFTFQPMPGVEMSNWISYDKMNALVGFDLNSVVLQRQTKDEAELPVCAVGIIRLADDEPIDFQKFYEETGEYINSISQTGQAQIQNLDPIYLGDVPALLMTGTARDPRSNTQLTVYVVGAPVDYAMYYFVSIVTGDDAYQKQALDMLLSLRFANGLPTLGGTAAPSIPASTLVPASANTANR